MREQLLYYAIKYEGDYNKISKAIHNCYKWNKIIYNGNYITILDKGYPKKLLRLCNPPYVLFYEGDIALLNKESTGIVGSRLPCQYGIKMCEEISNYLKEDLCIVSGLAKGIDAIAHLCAIAHQTIGVIGCGLDIVYPKENSSLFDSMFQKQLIISEYPIGVAPLASHFPMRNRIIAGLSNSVIVCCAKRRSGTLLTVNEAIQIGVNVYCVPHTINEKDGEGCNMLIQQGANIIVNIQDLAELK